MIACLVDANASPDELAEQLHLTLQQVADLGMDESVLRTVRRLARLADIRAQMLLSRYRASAALRLIAIASAEDPTELSRKACVDLLKIDLPVFADADEPPDERHLGAPDAEAIRRAFEELGDGSA